MSTRPLTFELMLLALVAVHSLGCGLMRGAVSNLNRVQTSWNPSPPERAAFRADEGLEAVCAAGSLNYLVPVEGGVVLVDAGWDESGAQLEKALKGRKGLAVLLTHAHIDHRSAAHQFGAPVYLGRGDVPLLENRYHYKRFLVSLVSVLGVPPLPAQVIPVDDGAELIFGGRTFKAIALPGHTPGSTAWLTGPFLFTGDAAQSPLGDGIYPAPGTVTEDMPGAYQSLSKLLGLDFETMLDAHYGRLDDPKRFLPVALVRGESPDTLYDHPSTRPAGCKE